ncbi:MAG: glycine cleavage system protein GcvH [Thermoguttaceae bacterium]|nr:glycine cleavage system protein GcvH [Thermoguttaceae bacterium]
MIPEQLSFTKTHEWVHLETDASGQRVATVGVSKFALESLTDLVYIGLPDVGQQVNAGKPFGEVESVKAVSDLYSPADGEVIAVNAAVADKLETLSEDPYGAGWLVKIRLRDKAELQDLLDYTAYQKQIQEELDEQ